MIALCQMYYTLCDPMHVMHFGLLLQATVSACGHSPTGGDEQTDGEACP